MEDNPPEWTYDYTKHVIDTINDCSNTFCKYPKCDCTGVVRQKVEFKHVPPSEKQEEEPLCDWSEVFNLYEKETGSNLLISDCVIVWLNKNYSISPNEWVRYCWTDINSRPKEYGRYEVFRKGAGKQHYETWNGSGWASNNGDITHYRKILTP